MNRRPSRFSDKALKYYRVCCYEPNVRTFLPVMKNVGGDDYDYVLKKSKERWGSLSTIEEGEPNITKDEDLDEIFLDE